jgi:transposase
MLDQLNRHDLTDEEWDRLRVFLRADPPRGGRWADNRMVINGIFFRTRTGCPWRDLPEGFGHWKTIYNRHRRWSMDGTWEQILDRLRAGCDEAEGRDWTVSADSTVVRAHQHAAGARGPGPRAWSRGHQRMTRTTRPRRRRRTPGLGGLVAWPLAVARWIGRPAGCRDARRGQGQEGDFEAVGGVVTDRSRAARLISGPGRGRLHAGPPGFEAGHPWPCGRPVPRGAALPGVGYKNYKYYKPAGSGPGSAGRRSRPDRSEAVTATARY